MPEKGNEKVGSWIVIIFAIFPAMVAADFMPDWNVLPMGGWMGVAALGCAIGGAVYGGKRLWALGSFCGAVVGVGVVGAHWVYTDLMFSDRNKFYNLELAVVFLVGAVPGFLFYYFGLRSKVTEESLLPPEVPGE